VTFFLQTTVCPKIALADIMPNLPIVLLVSIGFMRGKKEGLLTGFFLGLLFDIFYGGFLGYYALLYMTVGYISGSFHHLFFDFEIKLPMMITLLCDFLYGIFNCLVSFILHGKFHLFFYIGRILIPEMLYTLAFTLVFYRFFHWIDSRLERRESKRSANDLVS
jgi:rod shape-determining protein MreD